MYLSGQGVMRETSFEQDRATTSTVRVKPGAGYKLLRLSIKNVLFLRFDAAKKKRRRVMNMEWKLVRSVVFSQCCCDSKNSNLLGWKKRKGILFSRNTKLTFWTDLLWQEFMQTGHVSTVSWRYLDGRSKRQIVPSSMLLYIFSPPHTELFILITPGCHH